jgi:hypothetical protein
LLGEEPFNRKAWIEHRLEELADIFAVSVGGFSVLDNHLHVLVRLDPDSALTWSDECELQSKPDPHSARSTAEPVAV